MGNKRLDLAGISKSYGGLRLFENLNLSVSSGQVVLITGDNGTGKSTLFNLITGVDKPNNGTIVWNDVNVTYKNIEEISNLGIGRLYQNPRVFKSLTVLDSLIIASKLNYADSLWKTVLFPKKTKLEINKITEKAIEQLKKLNLEHLLDRITGELSYGQQKLVSLLMLFMNDIQFALLDEPFAGLNPQTIQIFSQLILDKRSEGIGFLIIEHNIKSSLAISDTHYELSQSSLQLKSA